MATKHSSAWWLALPFRAMGYFVREVFFPRKPQSPIGYWAKDRHGRWELRVPAYRPDEEPPKL